MNRVIEDANDIANAYDTGYIGTEHILFGLICEEKSAAGRLLKEMGADRTRYKEEFRRSIDRTTMVRGYTPRTKRLFATATEVALRGPVKTIPGTEHMLYAVLSMKDCLAVLILKRMGIDLYNLSLRVEQLVFAPGEEQAKAQESRRRRRNRRKATARSAAPKKTSPPPPSRKRRRRRRKARSAPSSRHTAKTSPKRRASASSIPSSAGTKRSKKSCRSYPAAPRTTPF